MTTPRICPALYTLYIAALANDTNTLQIQLQELSKSVRIQICKIIYLQETGRSQVPCDWRYQTVVLDPAKVQDVINLIAKEMLLSLKTNQKVHITQECDNPSTLILLEKLDSVFS